MPASTGRPVAVFRVHPATFWVTLLASLLLQTLLPLTIPIARLVDFPLLVLIYFALQRRSKVFAICLGTGLGLVQDAFTHGYVGTYGIVKALVGYLAAWAGIQFELESLATRSVLTGAFVLTHSLCLAGLQHALLETPPPFLPLEVTSGLMLNVALGLILFLVLDRFRLAA